MAETMAERRARLTRELEAAKREEAAAARGSDDHLIQSPPTAAEMIDDEDDEIENPPDVMPVEEPFPVPVIDGWPERRTFLLSLIRDEELRAEITDDELRAMDARILKKARDERRKQALADLEEDLLHRARVDENLLSANTLRTMEEKARLATKVRVRFVLPGDGAGHNGPNGFRIDGRIFENGQWNVMSVAEMESLRETHYLAHVAEIQFATLDQGRKAGLGINPNSRAQGTTAARILMSRSPATMEVEPLLA